MYRPWAVLHTLCKKHNVKAHSDRKNWDANGKPMLAGLSPRHNSPALFYNALKVPPSPPGENLECVIGVT
jgi:hypothetical protein